MKFIDITVVDASRSRNIPITISLPEIRGAAPTPLMLFGPGYSGPNALRATPLEQWGYRQHTYLADYFVQRGCGFVTIQHDLIEDTDGLDGLDASAVQHHARKHLYVRGVQNIHAVLAELHRQDLGLNLQCFMVGGHSNGGDIAKYFANLHPERVSHVVALDARRCRVEPMVASDGMKLLMFEANDTSTDPGVLPPPVGDGIMPSRRTSVEWTVIKPREALHASYMDAHMIEPLKQTIFRALDWFLV